MGDEEFKEVIGRSGIKEKKRSRGGGQSAGRDEQEEKGEVGVTYLALVQDINWHVVGRGGEVSWSSAATGLLNILLLRQEGRPNIKDTR